MVCEGSNVLSDVSDYSVQLKKARCDRCGKVVKVSFPDSNKKNLAKLVRHYRKEVM